MVKSQYKRDQHHRSGHNEKTATQLRRSVLQDFNFPIHILSFGPPKAVS